MPRVDLPQECVDTLSLHLEESGISDVALLEALEILPDLEHGRGERPLDVAIVCHKCEEEIDDGEVMGTAFGSFYHGRCVPRVDEPMPLAQFLAGAEGGATAR